MRLWALTAAVLVAVLGAAAVAGLGGCQRAIADLAAASEALGPAAAVYEQLDSFDDEIAGDWQIKAVADYHARLRRYQDAQRAARGCT